MLRNTLEQQNAEKVSAFFRAEFVSDALGKDWSWNLGSTDKKRWEKKIFSRADLAALRREEKWIQSEVGTYFYGDSTKWRVTFITAQIDYLIRMGAES